ncbi:DUF2637 domain-containing protein [Micromonospora sp. CPCC 205371]|nr:DUF2637 domain-containing protein [Micromonospora sp. CPCC 205371]
MTEWLTRLRPEPGGGMDPAIATPSEGDGVVTRILETVEGALGHVPTIVWVVALAAVTVTALITLPIAKRRIRAAGAGNAVDLRDRLLLIGALAPAGGFWLAVLLGSARGLTAFGRDDLRWTDGWEYLVPLTLDGVAIAFGLLAFRAVRKNRNPDRAVRVAWGAMVASAAINFGHEAGLANGSYLGGFYLGLMSLLGMLIFDELLAQFEDGTGEVRRKNPKYGLRWLTWPSNTACAWVAWRNYPPADGTPATVAASVQHLEQVRAAKRARRVAEAQAGTATPWWAPILPWVWIGRLDAIAEAERAAGDKQRTELSAAADAARAASEQQAETHRAELAALRSQISDAVEQTRTGWAEQLAAVEAERDAERSARLRAEQQAEHARSEAVRRLEQLRNEHAEQIAELRDQMTETAGRGARSVVTPMRRSKTTKRAPEQPLTDEQSLAEMFAEHPERDFAWTTREVNRITGAGFSARAPRLVDRAVEHLKTCDAERHDRCFGTARSSERSDDAEERSA